MEIALLIVTILLLVGLGGLVAWGYRDLYRRHTELEQRVAAKNADVKDEVNAIAHEVTAHLTELETHLRVVDNRTSRWGRLEEHNRRVDQLGQAIASAAPFQPVGAWAPGDDPALGRHSEGDGRHLFTPSGENPSDNVLIVAPTRVRGDEVRDWVAHYSKTGWSWPAVVKEFYDRAAADPEISDFFLDVDLTELRKHFTLAMNVVTKVGLTRGKLRELGQVHRHVRNSKGRHIDGEVFDKTVGVLVDVLKEAGVPQDGIDDLARVVPPLREVIVVADERVGEKT